MGRPPALDMWRRGVAIGLGTDGVSTLGTLDLFRVAMLVRIGQQHIYATPVHNRNGVSAREPLEMAIVGGARAMGTGEHTGGLEVGKRADVVLLATDGPDAAGYASETVFLYECASGRDVHTVLVDGRVVVKDREVLTADTAEIRMRARARQNELSKVLQ
ncbi:amidohydrolase family protein [Gordonia sp. DT30]|uniref:amidohydrolase family protein n=1 Tax=Gordonia sp. DT30 TaxID=3416546 RepID=UPI003CE7F86D